MRSFQTLFLLSTALLLAQISAFSSSPATSFGRSTALFDADTTEAAATSLDYKTQWKVDDSYTKTASGLLYKDTKVGSGESPDEGGTIGIHYAFWIDQFEDENDEKGTLYFNTRNEKNPKMEPLGMQYGESAQILKGWLEGMKTMKKGGKRVLIIPPELGYGDQEVPANPPRFPAIPVGTFLRFEVEMVDVDNSAWTKFRRMVPKPSSILDA